MPSFLPYSRQEIDEDDIAAVAQVLRSDWLTTGPMVESFEAGLASITGAAHAVACSNGTTALHLTCLALGLGPGDAVVVPAITFLASANAARYTGAEVIFADCDANSGLMGAEEFEAALARAEQPVKAVFPVHLGGQCGDLQAISQIAAQRHINVVEDGAQALGAKHKTEGNAFVPVGACRYSAMTTFSFHPVKSIALGEGGAVMTNSEELSVKLREFRNHGMTRDPDRFVNHEMARSPTGEPNPWYYEMHSLGNNYRVPDINSALGVSQLKKLDRFITRRRELANLYDRHFADFSPLLRPVERSGACQSAWHLYAVLIDFEAAGVSRAEAMKVLREAGIGTQVHYIPVHLQPYYNLRYGELELHGAQAYYDRTLSLPLFPAMTDDDVERVVTSVKSVLGI